jgi:hypothetical protein
VATPSGGLFQYDFTVFNTSTPDEINPLIVNWELPFFSLDDLDISSITSPEGWVFEIINPSDSTFIYNNPNGPYGEYSWDWDAATDPTLLADPNAYGPNVDVFVDPPFLIHWYTTPDDIGDGLFLPTAPIAPGSSLSGFGFESDFASVNAPYQSSWFLQPPVTGDPPIPGSAFGTPFSPARQQAQGGVIPEPASIGIWSLLAATVAFRVRRRKAAA